MIQHKGKHLRQESESVYVVQGIWCFNKCSLMNPMVTGGMPTAIFTARGWFTTLAQTSVVVSRLRRLCKTRAFADAAARAVKETTLKKRILTQNPRTRGDEGEHKKKNWRDTWSQTGSPGFYSSTIRAQGTKPPLDISTSRAARRRLREHQIGE